MKSLLCVLATFLLCLVCLTVRSDEVKGCISSVARAEDARLERKVNLSENRLPLGAVLASLAKQTGVATQMDERDTLSGIPVVVVFRDVPLADAMNAIWSLLSFPNAPWRWETRGMNGHYVYSLTPTFAARQFPARLRADIQAKFETHASVMLRLAQMSPDERKNHIKELSATYMQSQDRTATAWINNDLKWQGLKTFADSLSPDDQTQVLRSQKQIELPVSQLTASGRAFITSSMDRINAASRNADGTPMSLPEPDKVTFGTNFASGQQGITPVLYIYVGGAGFSYMGGSALDMGVKDWIGRQWLLPGDSSQDALETRVLTKPATAALAPSASAGVTDYYETARGLTEMAAAAPLSMLALVDEGERHSIPRVTYGKTVADYLKEATLYGWLNKKWRGHILLLSAPIPVLDGDDNLPYWLIKRLTSYGVRGNSFLSLQDMADVQATVSTRQLLYNSRRYVLLRTIAQYAPLFAYYATDRDLARTGGTRLGSKLAQVLRQTFGLPPQHPIFSGQDTWVRLSFREDDAAFLPTQYGRLEYMKSDRKWVFLNGFRQVGTSLDEAP